MPTDETKIATIGKDIEYMRKDIAEIKQSVKDLSGVYLTRAEFVDFKTTDFANVKKLVYGAVTLILTGFVGAVVALVYKK